MKDYYKQIYHIIFICCAKIIFLLPRDSSKMYGLYSPQVVLVRLFTEYVVVICLYVFCIF